MDGIGPPISHVNNNKTAEVATMGSSLPSGTERVSTSVTPDSSLEILSRREIEQLYDASQAELYQC